jgi:hypothetical protein
MEKDKVKTRVVFRKWKDGRQTVIALFPDIPEVRGCVLSYEHIGQHGGADYTGVIHATSLATPDEYASLARELEGQGYLLDICERA